MYRNILKIITVFFVMLALIVPVTLEKLPAINEKYDMAKALEDNVLQNYVKASSDAKQEKNPSSIICSWRRTTSCILSTRTTSS